MFLQHIHLTLCLWLFFSLQGLPTNQTTTTTTSWSGSSASATATTASHARSSIAKVVNPLGTVTTIVESQHESQLDADEFAEEYSSGAYIHENCDESMFRPYVAVISGSIDDGGGGGCGSDAMESMAQEKPEPIGQKLIVPVIDSAQLEQQNREKSRQLEMKRRRQDDEAKRCQDDENIAKFEQMSLLNRKDKSKMDSKVEEAAQKKSTAVDERKSSSSASSKNLMASKEPEKSSDEKRNEPMTKSEKKGKNDTETVTIKLKKKPNKAQVSKSIEPSIECDDTATKKTKSSAVADELSEQRCDSDPIVEFVAPKPMKSKKKASIDSGSSKESSVEKDLVMITDATSAMTVAAATVTTPIVEPTSKSKKKKQRKSEAAVAAAAAAISTSSSDDAKGGSTSEQLFVLKGSSKIESETERSASIGRNPFLMEDIERIDGAKCAEIQESLLKASISATVSIRKGSYQEKQQPQHRDTDDSVDAAKPSSSSTLPASSSGKSGKKKKWSKESIESLETAASNNSPINVMDEFTYPDPSELTDADNLSFKSTIDDPIIIIPLESIANVDDVEWPTLSKGGRSSGAAVASDYDKLSDEAEMGSSGTQYDDCKNFQLIIDEPESYMRTTTTISDTNSSDEAEDSSKSTKSTSEKIIDDDDDDCDEELQPLIRSTASDSAAADLSSAKGSDDTLPNQGDSMAQPTAEAATATSAEANEPSQSQPQKQTNSSTTTTSGGGGGNSTNNNNNINKKKFRKKRR